MYCLHCGTVGKPKRYMKGSIFVEMFLWGAFWLFVAAGLLAGILAFLVAAIFLVTGLAYSLWRQFSACQGCGACQTAGMIPEDSPLALARFPGGGQLACRGCGWSGPAQGQRFCPRCGLRALVGEHLAHAATASR